MKDYKYMAQDLDGEVYLMRNKPTAKSGCVWSYIDDDYESFMTGVTNQSWGDTLIDLAVDNFKIEGGILTRTTKQKLKIKVSLHIYNGVPYCQIAHDSNSERKIESQESFVKWIDEGWREVEVCVK